MRLFEVVDTFVDDLETLLRNQIGSSNADHASQTLSWEALSNMLIPLGYGKIDFAAFRDIYLKNPTIQSLVRNYNKDNGVILGTDIEPRENPNDQQPTDVPDGPSVDTMAHHGSQKLNPDI
jgi:hypothetical protein